MGAAVAAVAVLLSVTVAPASAANFTWVGGSGSWNVAANWNPSTGVPGANDTANVSTGTPTVTASTSVGRLARTGGDLVIGVGVTLTAAGSALANDGVTVVTGNTISGGGTIHGGGALTLNGQTTVGSVAMCDSSASSGVTLTLNDQTGVADSTFIGAGTLGLGRGAKLENKGQLSLVNGSAISASQDAIYTVHNAPGGTMFFASLTASSLNNFDNDGTLHVDQNGLSITGNNPSPPSSGDWVIAAAKVMSVAVGADSWAGNVSGDGKLVLNGFGDVSMTSTSSFAPGAVEINGGTLTLNTLATTISGPTLKIDAGGTLNVAAGHTYSPPSATIVTGSLGGAGTLVLSGQALGSLNISAATLKLLGATTWGTGTINIGNGATVLNTGTLNVGGTASLGGLNDSIGTLTNQAGATINASGGTLTHLVNAGTLTISAGSPGVEGSQSAGGLTVVSPGTTLAQAGGNYVLNGGILRGFGTVAANLVNSAGTVAPGGSVGVLTLTGNYTQGAGGTLLVEISGTTLGGDFGGKGYDHLQITGDATLAGTLAIVNDPLFDPLVGQTFTVLTTAPGNVNGTFAQLTGDTVGVKRYSASYLPATPPRKNVVLGLSLSPPLNEAPPLITPPAARPGDTLTCSDGTWTGATSFAHAWRSDGTDIPGQSGGTYVVQAGDVGHVLDCRVTATNAAGPASQLSSNSVTPTATPVTPAPSQAPPAATPKATPATTEPATIKPSQVITLPSTKVCVSRRSFRIRLRAPAGVTIASAAVFVNGKRADVVKGKRLSAPVNLTGLPKGRFSVKITVTTATGRKVTDTRRYKTCAPKRR